MFASLKFRFSRTTDFNIVNDRSTGGDVGWHVNNLAYNAGEISGLLNPQKLMHYFVLINHKNVASNT